MDFQQLLEEVKQYVLTYFDTHHDDELLYHDLKHTKNVVATATRIANHYQLSDEDFFIVITAAWFHDTGYFTDKANHEARSAELAAEFLKEKTGQEVIDKITGCIIATTMPQKPNGLLQEILCDADLFHLGTDKFIGRSKQLRKEFEKFKHADIDRQQWRQKNIELLENHRYFTDYAQLLLSDQQEKNLQKLKEKQAETLEDKQQEGGKKDDVKDEVSMFKPEDEKNGPKLEKVKKKPKGERPEKGIETMFRITSGNNQRLSDMADQKAHILITVNSIILSAIISLVLKKLDENAFLAIPSFILLSISLVSMIFSILATRPHIPNGTYTQQDMDNKTVNLLFFGNFYRMNLEDYTHGMIKVMNDSDFLYGTLIKDVYSQGVVLGRKYRLLRAAYNIFMFGLIVAVVAFIISSIIHNSAVPALPAH
ncbi:Pycsar system effector family protein [Mucilaginibacter boryungensis]|uniref:Phosphohydrolase n=1 Tax=Mucilaginibacter boryungensis TaxID=768480 RepID=A0ABR9XFK8_9SPHI|nr:Pycsar system effector family protein [Mucilaginibacter boryungensis]MBE9666188.1 phosphohydrolase [Mucilaginibacter boryungensis]